MRTPDDAGGQLAYRIPRVAKKLDISPQTVARLIERGELRAVKIGCATLVPAADLDRFCAARGIDAELAS